MFSKDRALNLNHWAQVDNIQFDYSSIYKTLVIHQVGIRKLFSFLALTLYVTDQYKFLWAFFDLWLKCIGKGFLNV
jgi:hypothetical protein